MDKDRQIGNVEFDQCWELYPRKVAKKAARLAWAKLSADQRWVAFEALKVHVKYWASAGRTAETTPHFSSWIHGERWEDDIEMPTKPQEQWWATELGTMRKAREVGLSARPGESLNEFRQRVREKVAA